MIGLKRMKKKRIIKLISSMLIWSVLFLFLLIVQSARWFLVKFEGLDISVAIYQMLSPLKGTSSSVIWEYCATCLLPALFLSSMILLLYLCYEAVMDKMYFDIHIRTNHYLTNSYREYCFSFKKNKKICKVVIPLSLIMAMVIILWNMANKVGLPEYIQYMTASSEIMDIYYKAPEDVEMVFPEKKRNLIVLYMESMESTFADESSGGEEEVNYIPELTWLAEQGINFSNSDMLGGAYGMSGAGWTVAALLAYQTGVTYKLPVESTADYEEFLPGIKGMGEILEQNGYANYFMCGSDSVFGGRKNLFEQHGNYKVFDWLTAKEEKFISDDYNVFWGMEDARVYEYAKMHLKEIGALGTPFNFTMLTVDTHFPEGYTCELCEDKYPEKYANVIACASRQAYEFVEWIKEQEWYTNTTIVIVGDHLSMKSDFFDNIEEADRRIYNCFYNLPEELMICPNKNRVFNTTDLYPTILASIGVSIDGEKLGIGTNLFSDVPTLQEQIGTEELASELNKYSEFYFEQFVTGKD